MLNQLSLFGDLVAEGRLRQRSHTLGRRTADEEAPAQRELRLKIRKRAFKARIRDRGTSNDEHWSELAAIRIHQELLNDWAAAMTRSDLSYRDQFDYWTWALGSPTEAFSFHDCLVADGYGHPGVVIEYLRERRPEWLGVIEELSLEDQARIAKAMDAQSVAN